MVHLQLHILYNRLSKKLCKEGVRVNMIYLDNNATTKVLQEVTDDMMKYLTQYYGNPSSKYYELADISKKAVEKARTQVALLFDCEPDEVVFTSGASESNNFILKGIADIQIKNKNHIITTKVEHASVLETLRYLETKGFYVTYLDVNKDGTVDINDIENHITPNTFLVSVMWVNNELGSINNIKAIANICKNSGVFLHVDATQAVGKVDVSIPDGVNFVSMSAHKIYGPKGSGVAIIKKDSFGVPIRLTPLIHGGEQENNYRAGTLCVHNIVGLGKACEIVLRDFESNQKRLIEQEFFLVNLLQEKLGGSIVFNSTFNGNKVPGVINFQIKDVKNVIFLSKISKFVAASSGSACSITHPSYTLKAIGLSDKQISESVRFSLSPYENIKPLEDIL